MRKDHWDWIRVASGYGLFIAAIVYAVYKAPRNIWDLQPAWLIVTISMLLLLIVMQVLQVVVFLKAYGIQIEIRWVTLFAIKRGLLNAILPIRGGTLIMMRAMTLRYPVKWQDYLKFNLISGAISMLWSLMALAWLLFGLIGFITVVFISSLTIYFLLNLNKLPYRNSLPHLAWIACGLYTTILMVFWSLLNGMGQEIGFRDAMYYATALNALAQISITPGNLGVREWAMGILAPYLALPMAVGILAGGIFHVLRVIVFALMLFVVGVKRDMAPN